MRPLLCLVLAAAACGDGSEAGFSYPLDGVLRMNHVQAKGTHNSYHVDPGINFEPWSYTQLPLDEQLEQQGVRQFELDMYYFDTDAEPRIEIHHVPPDSKSTCHLLPDCLKKIGRWSADHPAHHPIVILLEPKDDFDPARAEAFMAKIEADILSAFPRERLITPDLVKGDAPSLREAILTKGWPTLGQVRGRVMFALLDWGGHRDALTHGGKDLDGRLIFAISDIRQPYASVLLVDDAITGAAEIREAVDAGFLVRTRADVDGVEARAGDRTRMDAALASGAQMVSTDFPAAFAATGYKLDMPGGAPTRCNPVTAPPECTPQAIEDPAFMH